MSEWPELQAEAEQHQAEMVILGALFLEAWSLNQRGLPMTAPLAAVERAARLGTFGAFEGAARLQLLELSPAARFPAQLLEIGERLAVQQATLIRERAELVLSRSSEAMVSAYADLVRTSLVNSAVRSGTTAGGIYGGATHKTFVRISSARERRGHSVYEGSSRPLDGTWRIAGIDVQGPGDARLPLRETINCGHAVRYH